jgi:hypothetical protein
MQPATSTFFERIVRILMAARATCQRFVESVVALIEMALVMLLLYATA